jgi:hypothetical protein
VFGLKSVCYILVIDRTIHVLLINYASVLCQVFSMFSIIHDDFVDSHVHVFISVGVNRVSVVYQKQLRAHMYIYML